VSQSEIMYCPRCKVKWIAKNCKETICPECGLDRFFLLQAGQFGTLSHFDQSGEDPQDYRLVSKGVESK